MAVIYTYPKLETPDVLDLLLVTDVTDSNKTKQTTVKGIGDAIDVVDSITSLEPISVSSSTGDVEISLTGINGFGSAGQVLAVNQAEDALEYIDGGGGGSISVGDASTTVDPTKILNFTGKIFTVTADVTDATQADVAGSYNTLVADSTLTVKDVGSINSGTLASTLKGNDIVNLLDKIFFPTVPPTYVNPTFSITKTQAGPFEPGAQVSNMGITLKFINKDSAGFDVGQGMTLTRSNPQATLAPTSTTTTTLANLAPQFPNSQNPAPNNPQERQTYVYSDSFIVDNTYTAVSQSVTYTGGASYLAGGILQDSAGNPSPPSTIPPSPITGSTSFTVLYPWFWGISIESAGGINFPTSGYATSIAKVKEVIEAGGLTGYSYNKELESSTGTITAAFNNTSGNTWMWFAHPAANTTKAIWYESATATGNIGGTLFFDAPDNFFNANLFSAPSTQTIITTTAFGWTHPYKIYIALKSASTTTIELRNP
jgi:hypothetical protein